MREQRPSSIAVIMWIVTICLPLAIAVLPASGISLHKGLVDSGKMTNRAFHDAILKENRIPIERMRAILTKQKLTRDYTANWKFYGPNPAAN